MDFNTIPNGYPGKMTPRELRAATKSLLKDTEFLQKYKQKVGTPCSRAVGRRDMINSALIDKHFTESTADDREQIRRVLDDVLNLPAPLNNARAEARTLRFMQDPVAWEDEPFKAKAAPQPARTTPPDDLLNTFRDAWMWEPSPSNRRLIDDVLASKVRIHEEMLATMLCSPLFINPNQPKKETTMNTTPITVTTKTFTYVNGTDINNFRSADLYDLIAREEDQIRKLEAIENKPVTLQQEIARRRQGIADLVAHLDSQVQVAQAVV